MAAVPMKRSTRYCLISWRVCRGCQRPFAWSATKGGRRAQETCSPSCASKVYRAASAHAMQPIGVQLAVAERQAKVRERVTRHLRAAIEAKGSPLTLREAFEVGYRAGYQAGRERKRRVVRSVAA